MTFGAKGRLYSTCGHSVMLYRSETWPAEEEDMIGLEGNDARMVRWVYNFRPDDGVSS